MIHSDPQQIVKEWGAIRPPVSFALLALTLLGGLCLGAATLFDSVAIPVVLFALISGLGLRGLLTSYPHGALGFCNGVTLARAALVALLAGAVADPGVDRWVVFVIACVAFAMDGLDGWLARRSGLSSGFGARFDMEIDALLGAVLALVLLSGGVVGLEILVLGLMRYAFVALSLPLPGLRGHLPESLRRKAICVVQIAALLVLLCPLMPAALASPLAVSAAALLLWSFAIDICWLLRTPR